MGIENDEPLTPAGRLFIQPATNQIINCALGLERSIGIDVVRTVFSDSLMIKHPRFSSLLVTDNHGREYWRKTELEIDRHLILHSDPVGEFVGNDEAAVNDYLADLSVSTPLSHDKPLWEIHILSAHKALVFRFHHALGDGTSIMSLVLTVCKKLDDPEQTPTIEPLISSTRSSRGLKTGEKFLKVLKTIWFTLIYLLEFIMRALWVKDGKTVVTGGEGVELWPRKLSTAKFSLEDMKTVKSAVSNAVYFRSSQARVKSISIKPSSITINDILFGIISLGLSKYLENRSPKFLREGLQITGVALVNLRPSPGLQKIKELMRKNTRSGWGNKIGIMLLPIYYHKNYNPLQYLKRAKMMIDRKKLSVESILSYQITNFVTNRLGSKAITMHMVSYAGKADMQILVAKDVIPDPDTLAEYFEDALFEMKEAAEQK